MQTHQLGQKTEENRKNLYQVDLLLINPRLPVNDVNLLFYQDLQMRLMRREKETRMQPKDIGSAEKLKGRE